MLIARMATALPSLHRSFREVLRQMFIVGNGSLPLVMITSVFTGAVAAVQSAYQMGDYVPVNLLGTVVAKMVFIELGPVLTALVVGARVSSSIAAELGTMRVTEQIDALEMLAIDPVRYLALPRFVACVLMLPVLTIFADLVAVLGAFIVSTFTLDITTKVFTSGLRFLFYAHDIWGGLIKAAVFGGIIAVSGVVSGFNTEGGAQGVGSAAMHAVVSSALMVLVADYLLATIIFQVFFGS
jgi:phospholipid/cholesterol/gamma-HCH transport system permease protein